MIKKITSEIISEWKDFYNKTISTELNIIQRPQRKCSLRNLFDKETDQLLQDKSRIHRNTTVLLNQQNNINIKRRRVTNKENTKSKSRNKSMIMKRPKKKVKSQDIGLCDDAVVVNTGKDLDDNRNIEVCINEQKGSVTIISVNEKIKITDGVDDNLSNNMRDEGNISDKENINTITNKKEKPNIVKTFNVSEIDNTEKDEVYMSSVKELVKDMKLDTDKKTNFMDSQKITNIADNKIKKPTIINLEEANMRLKNIFKREKEKIEIKRNSMFVDKKDVDINKIVRDVLGNKKTELKAVNKKEMNTVMIKEKASSSKAEKILSKQKEVIIKDILSKQNEGKDERKNDADKKVNNNNLHGQKTSTSIVLSKDSGDILCKDIKTNIDTSKLRKLSNLFVNDTKHIKKTEPPKIQPVLNNENIYDVKTSKFYKDTISIRKDLYKEVIDNQRKKIVPNTYKPKTVIPYIKSDDEDSMLFIEPSFSKDPNLNNKVCLQDHCELEEYFNIEEKVDLISLFPNIKDVTNDSPNKWT